ncbi:MAG: LL-diaminopimelate aminotransferase [Chloroflexi bacterium]|nr:LL-diaminopimelate aminotransferase [Chloroflexota bacterium]
MRFSQRLEKLPPYLFVEISRKIAEKRAKGEDVVTFGVGDPDLPTPQHVLEAGAEASSVPANHRYPETDGLPELRRAIAGWYEGRFGVRLDPSKEVLPLIGAKEGVAHAALAFVDPGDVALIGDPAYPACWAGVMFAGGEPYSMPLLEENGFRPDLTSVPRQAAEKATMMYLNYPNNPTAGLAELDFFEEAVAFAKRHDIPLLHDACYTEVAFDGYRPHSILELPGARDIAIEFHSLSKTYNMTGWRIGMAVGNAQLVNALFKIKSNLDSGIPQSIQQMGIAALSGPQDYLAQRNAIYQRRRDKLIPVLARLGLRMSSPKASLYLWARVPQGYTSGQYATMLLDQLSIVVSPGRGFGKYGEGYVRLSMTVSDSDVDKAVERLRGWKPKG